MPTYLQASFKTYNPAFLPFLKKHNDFMFSMSF